MAAEHDKHMVHKDLEAKDEEMEQLRYNMQKKVSPQFVQLVLFCIFLFLGRGMFIEIAEIDLKYYNRMLTDLSFIITDQAARGTARRRIPGQNRGC